MRSMGTADPKLKPPWSLWLEFFIRKSAKITAKNAGI
jgi:hypothetical protein